MRKLLAKVAVVVTATATLIPATGAFQPASAYVAKITMADLKAAGAKCVGTTCTYNGAVWDCKGGGYCTKVALS